MEEQKEYKNLGNAIRESVFAKKDAPTMLPDRTIEKLGLSEDDVLSMEEELTMDEAVNTKHFFDVLADFVVTQAHDEGLDLTDPKSTRLISNVLKQVDREMSKQQKMLAKAQKGK